MRNLLNFDKHPDDITCLHGIRALSTLGILFHHSVAYRVHYGDKNAESYKNFHRSGFNYALTSFTNIVDTFFVISSALLTRSMLRDSKA